MTIKAGVLLSLVLLLGLVLPLTVSTQGTSVLSSVAASMVAGEFREITTQMVNLNNASVPGYFSNLTTEDIWQFDANTYVNQYTDLAGMWDPTTKKLHWDGMSHTGYYRHITYTDSTNRWDMVADNWGGNDGSWYNGTNIYNAMALQHPNFTAYGVTPGSPTSHSYKNFTINPTGRYYYHWAATTCKINRLNLDTGAWTYFTDINPGVVSCYGQDGAMFWHPGLNSGSGGLIFTPGGGGWAYSNASNVWTYLTDNTPMGFRGNVGMYSTVAGVGLIGGGIPTAIANDPQNPIYQDPNHAGWAPAKRIHTVANNLTITEKTAAPFPIFVSMSVNTVDPATGEFLFLFLKTPFVPGSSIPQNTELWSFNAQTDIWTKRFNTLPFDPFTESSPLQGMAAAPISTYGVTMWLKHQGHQTRVWLYKHGTAVAPSGDITAPAVSITAPSNGAMVLGSSVTVSATATDAVGVVGVQFKLDGINLQPEDTTSTYGITWDSTTAVDGAHTLTALARDAAGNARSSSVSVTVANGGSPPANSSFDQKITALGSNLIGAWGFNGASDVREYPAGVEPLRYTWLRSGDGDPVHNQTAGTECDTALMGNTWAALGLGVGDANTVATRLVDPVRCNYPVIDTSTKFSGAGSLKLSVLTKSFYSATGFFKSPMAGLGATDYVGPGGALGNTLYFQYRYRLGSTANTFSITGSQGWKQIILQGDGAFSAVVQQSEVAGDPPCRFYTADCPNGHKPLVMAYGSIGSDIWGQNQNGCFFNYNNQDPLYQDPPCFLLKPSQWYEFTGKIEIRPSTTAASTSGAGSLVLTWPNGRFQANGFTDVYISGGTNCVAGMYTIASVQSATQVTLTTSPSPSGAGSNCTMFYSYDNNSKFQLWADGNLIIDNDTAKYAWGPHGAAFGWNNFNVSTYMTGKDETQDHPAVDIFYDDFLFAKAPIPMGGGVTLPPSDTTAPVVTITTPVNGAVASGAVTVTATATDAVGVVGVQFKVNGQNIGPEDTASAYTISWNTTTVPDGAKTLTAVARDAAGNQSISAPVVVNVANGVGQPPPPPPPPDTTAPTVSMTLPASGSTVSGAAVTLSAVGTDNIGVVGVQFKLDGANIGAEDTASPFTMVWSTSGVTDGSHTITATARDAAGNLTTSAGISVTVINFPPPPTPAPSDTTAPTVSFLTTSGTIFTNSKVIQFRSEDNVGVVKCETTINSVAGPIISIFTTGAKLPRTSQFYLQQATIPVGTYVLGVTCRDNAGNSTPAKPITIFRK